MKNILITGASGFIGSELLKALKEKDCNLTVVVRDGTFIKHSSVKLVTLNNMNFNEKYDVIVHLAAYLTPHSDIKSIKKVLQSNIDFGIELLGSLNKLKGSLFIDTGTSAEIFPTKKNKTSYFYAESKRAFELLSKNICDQKECIYTKIIPFSVYSNHIYFKQKKIFDLIVNSVMAKRPIEITNGNQVLDFVHVKDVVSMLINIIYSKSYPLLNNQVFQCGTGKGTSILQLSQLVSEVIGRKTNLDFGALEYRDRDIMYSVANFEKASSILGWYPKMDLRDQISKIKFLTEHHEIDP